MSIIGFPSAPKKEWVKPKTLEDWPWDKDLGKPYGDINGDVRPEIVGEALNVRIPSYIGEAPPKDSINPDHYKHHGIECIELTESMGFLEGNIVKYVYRYAAKGGEEDLDKADWYLQRLRKKIKRGKA